MRNVLRLLLRLLHVFSFIIFWLGGLLVSLLRLIALHGMLLLVLGWLHLCLTLFLHDSVGVLLGLA